MKRNQGKATFPQRLLQIINDESTNDIICWSEPHGLSFTIVDRDLSISVKNIF